MRGTVNVTSLNVRETPDTTKPPIGKLNSGDELGIASSLGSWYRLRTPLMSGVSGWVHGDYVTIISEHSGYLRDYPEFQSGAWWGFPHLDGGGPIVSTWNRLGGLLSAAADTIGLEPAVALTVFLVESGGRGINADGSLKIRFENHVFFDNWGKNNESPFWSCFTFNAKKRWQGHKYRQLSVAGAFGPWWNVHSRHQWTEREAFLIARTMNSRAAYLSISMGGAQIMGFNHHLIGYGSPEAMYDRFAADERFQILGLFDFIKGPGSTSPMLEALRRERWTDFAAHYNGLGQAARYGSLIEERVAAVRKVLG